MSAKWFRLPGDRSAALLSGAERSAENPTRRKLDAACWGEEGKGGLADAHPISVHWFFADGPPYKILEIVFCVFASLREDGPRIVEIVLRVFALATGRWTAAVWKLGQLGRYSAELAE